MESKREKYITHIYGIWKNGTDDLICKTEMDTQTYKKKMYGHQRQQGGGMNWEIEIGVIHVHCGYCV